MRPIPTAFDSLANDYDQTFTATELGRRHREAVWRRADRHFKPGMRVLDLGCGTGEDACHLAARGVSVLGIDGSEAMVAESSRKLAARGLTERASARHLSIADVTPALGRFDGALSNFGAVNCLPLEDVRRALAATVTPSGTAILVVMGPLAVWEWVWFMAHGRPRAALRRVPARGVRWRGLTIHYPSAQRLAAAMRPDFTLRRVAGIGTLVPPTFADEWALHHPQLVDRLDRLERRLETRWAITAFADHYIAEFERVNAG